MDEQALLGLNPNADARYRQRVRHYHTSPLIPPTHTPKTVTKIKQDGFTDAWVENGSKMTRQELKVVNLTQCHGYFNRSNAAKMRLISGVKEESGYWSFRLFRGSGGIITRTRMLCTMNASGQPDRLSATFTSSCRCLQVFSHCVCVWAGTKLHLVILKHAEDTSVAPFQRWDTNHTVQSFQKHDFLVKDSVQVLNWPAKKTSGAPSASNRNKISSAHSDQNLTSAPVNPLRM